MLFNPTSVLFFEVGDFLDEDKTVRLDSKKIIDNVLHIDITVLKPITVLSCTMNILKDDDLNAN
jgi:hypothetical protein